MVAISIIALIVGIFLITRKNKLKFREELIKANGGVARLYPNFCSYCSDSMLNEMTLLRDTGRYLEYRWKVVDGNKFEGFFIYGIEHTDYLQHLYCYATSVNGYKTPSKGIDLTKHINEGMNEPTISEYQVLIRNLVTNVIRTYNNKLQFRW